MLVEITCEACQRTATFRASDLLMIARPNLEMEAMRGKCVDCGTISGEVALMRGRTNSRAACCGCRAGCAKLSICENERIGVRVAEDEGWKGGASDWSASHANR